MPNTAATPPPDGEEHQPAVLVIEDNEHIRFCMMALLVREGYQVLTAPTGHDALAILRAPFARIDVVILDVYLPDVSGIDLCVRLRELYPSLPVIVCTGAATAAEGARLLELGVQRYFLKPIAPDELLASVEATLS